MLKSVVVWLIGTAVLGIFTIVGFDSLGISTFTPLLLCIHFLVLYLAENPVSRVALTVVFLAYVTVTVALVIIFVTYEYLDLQYIEYTQWFHYFMFYMASWFTFRREYTMDVIE